MPDRLSHSDELDLGRLDKPVRSRHRKNERTFITVAPPDMGDAVPLVEHLTARLVLSTREVHLTTQPFMHIGILVHDLEAAIARWSEVLDVTFTAPHFGHVPRMDYMGESAPIDINLAYSNQGPPYLELIETQEAGIYGREQGEGIHHIGVWEPNCQRRLERLTTQGVDAEVVQYDSTGEISIAYFEPAGLHGTRLEIVTEAQREMMEKWIQSGELPVL